MILSVTWSGRISDGVNDRAKASWKLCEFSLSNFQLSFLIFLLHSLWKMAELGGIFWLDIA